MEIDDVGVVVVSPMQNQISTMFVLKDDEEK
jgi:hypothetical protein